MASNKISDKNENHNHLLIAGTGRAGTSFLVEYFNALGFDTHLSREPDATMNDMANAGLEDIPLTTSAENLPYLIKTPWLYQFIDQLLEEDDFVIDGVIIPVRGLDEAAASRATIEYQAMHKSLPWMANLEKTWTDRGMTAGGLIYSIQPIDQARILAVGFHYLIERLLEKDVPFVLLSFPRFVEDPKYLFEKLRPFLQSKLTQKRAFEAFKETANSKMVRTTKELKSSAKAKGPHIPTAVEVENIALKREIDKARLDLQEASLQLANERAAHLKTVKSVQEEISSVREELKAIKNSTSWKVAQSMRNPNKFLQKRPDNNE